LGLVLQLFEACCGAGVIRHEELGIVAAKTDACLSLWNGCGLRGGDKAERDGGFADRLGEHLIVGGKLLDFLSEARQRIRLRPEVKRIRRRHAVGLREHHVDADRRRAIGGKFINEVGENCARPRPLPNLFQRFLIDVDNANGQIGIERAWAHPLIGVEYERAQPLDWARIPNAQRARGNDDRPHNQGVE